MEECKYFLIHRVLLHMGCDMTSLLHGMSAFNLLPYSHGHMRYCDTILALVGVVGVSAWVKVGLVLLDLGLWYRVNVYCLWLVGVGYV